MKLAHFTTSIHRALRSLVVMVLCAVLVLSSAVPAYAIGSTQSSPTEGSARLDQVQEKSEEALRNPPNTLKQVQSEANKGLNEIQGSADVQSMNRPSNSQQATSVEEQIGKVIDKIKGDS